jgi:hypothetical protein
VDPKKTLPEILQPVLWIRTIKSGSGSSISISGCRYGFKVLMTKLNKIQLKFFPFFWDQKVAIYLSIASIKDVQATGEPQPSKENKVIQHFKSRNFITVFYFSGPFFPSWIRIKNPDTDPGTLLNPDPQHCLQTLDLLETSSLIPHTVHCDEGSYPVKIY